jgi:hypothetical protein
LYLLAGLAYLRGGNTQAAMYPLSNAIARSTPAKMRVQRSAEMILTSLLQQKESGSEKAAPEGEPPSA